MHPSTSVPADEGINLHRSREESDEVLRAHLELRKKQYKADDLEFPEFKGHSCSYQALSNVKQKNFSTKWGPVGFTNNNHPLSIMVWNLSYNRRQVRAISAMAI